jgi:hypothetical protein
MSVEEKRGILRLFGEVFHLGEKDAAGLLISSSYLLAKGDELRGDLKRVMAPSLERFRAEQADSAIDLLRRVARLAGPPSDLQEALITAGIEPSHLAAARPSNPLGVRNEVSAGLAPTRPVAVTSVRPQAAPARRALVRSRCRWSTGIASGADPVPAGRPAW